jgi:hypothetical protein
MNKEDMTMNMGAMQDMMKGMMKNMGGMPDMCAKMMQQMAGAFSGSSDAAPSSTSEIGGLFDEWSRTVGEEIVAFIKEKGKASLPDIAAKLKISEESTLFFIVRLAREHKVTLGEIQVRPHGA